MRLPFAQVSQEGNVLSVKTLYSPFLYDFKVLVVQQWFPMAIMAGGLNYGATWFLGIKPVAEITTGGAIFWTLACLVVAAIILGNSQTVAQYVFDGEHDEVRINGRMVSQLRRVTVGLQTCVGWSGNRRFQLVILIPGRPEIVMTQTPLLEDGIWAHQYYGQTYGENVRTMFSSWTPYQGKRDAIDERDAEIFNLAQTIQEFLEARKGVACRSVSA